MKRYAVPLVWLLVLGLAACSKPSTKKTADQPKEAGTEKASPADAPKPAETKAATGKLDAESKKAVSEDDLLAEAVRKAEEEAQKPGSGTGVEEVWGYSKACVPKVEELYGVGPLVALDYAMNCAPYLSMKLGKFDKENEATVKQALDSLTKETSAIVGKALPSAPQHVVFRCLALASTSFLVSAGKRKTPEAFADALSNAERSTIESTARTLELSKYQKDQDAVKDTKLAAEALTLILLLDASGLFVDEKGKFRRDAFNAALAKVNEGKLKWAMGQMKSPDPTVALSALMRWYAGQAIGEQKQ